MIQVSLSFVFIDQFYHRYFTNDVLTKEYTLQYGFTDANAFKSSFRNSSDLAHYDGVPKVVDCKGCKVSFFTKQNTNDFPILFDV